MFKVIEFSSTCTIFFKNPEFWSGTVRVFVFVIFDPSIIFAFREGVECALEHPDSEEAKKEKPLEKSRKIAYSCSFCNKLFSTRKGLSQHLRYHTEEKTFSCSLCAKSFVYLKTLKQHMQRHTGGRPYSCNVCYKSFVGSSDLKRHYRIHTGERPYHCSLCNKTFSRKYSLKTHLQITHKGECVGERIDL